jgi:hypothetical protein
MLVCAAFDPGIVEHGPPFLPAILGLAMGLTAPEVQRGMPLREVLIRASMAAATYVITLVLFAVALDLGRRDLVTWLTAFLGLRNEALLFMLAMLAPVPVIAIGIAALARRFSPAWVAWLVESGTILLGACTAPLLARQALMVFCWVTLGPRSSATELLSFLLVHSQDLVGPSVGSLDILGVPVVIGAAFVALRLAGRLGRRGAILLVEGSAGVALLGTSLRLPALLAMIALAACEAAGRLDHHGVLRRSAAWAAILLLSFAPVDVSLQFLPGRPHLAPAISGLLTGSAYERAERGETVVVGGCGPMYNEPRWVWVW